MPYTQFPYSVQDRTIDLVFQMNEAGMSKLHPDWLEQLKDWIQSGKWLERVHPDGRAAHLDTVLVGLDYCLGLLYKLTEDDAYFQIFLNPDGTEQEGAFWSSEGDNEPELYTEEEMSAVEQHIKNVFGEFDMVRFYQEGGVETSMQSSMRIYRLFDLLLAPECTPHPEADLIAQAVQYIRAHVDRTIPLDELAASVCLSVSYFAHLFKQRTGFAPGDYMINARIERAKVLLIHTDDSISRIAEQVGYATSGSLINLFTKRVGVSPLQYRIASRNADAPGRKPGACRA